MIWIIREHGYGGSNLNVNLDFVAAKSMGYEIFGLRGVRLYTVLHKDIFGLRCSEARRLTEN